MKSYESFIQSQFIDISGNTLFIKNKGYKYTDADAYRTLLYSKINNIPLTEIANERVNKDIDTIEDYYENVAKKEDREYVNDFVQEYYFGNKILKKALLPIVNDIDKKFNTDNTIWNNIMTNLYLHKYLMVVYNYLEYSKKNINFDKYISFLVTNKDEIYFNPNKETQDGILYDEVFKILNFTGKKGERNEKTAIYQLNKLKYKAFTDVNYASEQFKPLFTKGEFFKPEGAEIDRIGTDLMKTPENITLQVKPLVSISGNTITSDGSIKPYATDYYVFVNSEYNNNLIYVVFNSPEVDVTKLKITAPNSESILVIGDKFNRYKK